MSDSPEIKETQNQTIILEDGILQPIEYRWEKGDGYKFSYTVRVPAPEIDGDHFKKATYYLKPDSEGSQTGQIHYIVDVQPYVGSIYFKREQERLLGPATYQLEQKRTENGTPTTSLTLNMPVSGKKDS